MNSKYGEVGSLKYQSSVLYKLWEKGSIDTLSEMTILLTGVVAGKVVKLLSLGKVNIDFVAKEQEGFINIARKVHGDQEGLITIAGKVNGNQQGAFMSIGGEIKGDQINLGGIQIANKVGGNQKQGFGFQLAGTVLDNQKQIIGVTQLVNRVGGDQIQMIGVLQGINIASLDQVQGFGLIQYGYNIGGNQEQIIGGCQLAGNIEGNQEQGIGLIQDVQGKVKGSQIQVCFGLRKFFNFLKYQLNK